jgi:hypothetical protein
VKFEPTISVLERAKTVHALDRAATVMGRELIASSGSAFPRGCFKENGLKKSAVPRGAAAMYVVPREIPTKNQ